MTSCTVQKFCYSSSIFSFSLAVLSALFSLFFFFPLFDKEDEDEEFENIYNRLSFYFSTIINDVKLMYFDHMKEIQDKELE